jgi:hypothetical protein
MTSGAYSIVRQSPVTYAASGKPGFRRRACEKVEYVEADCEGNFDRDRMERLIPVAVFRCR